MFNKILKPFTSLFTLGAFTVCIATSAFPVKAAEEIDFIYSPIEESLKISSLQKFAQDGTIDSNLAFYMNLAKPNEKQKALFRQLLIKKVEIDPIVLSRLLKTDEGERLLKIFGEIINIQGGSNGEIPLRGAIVTAALDREDGLTLLNVLSNLSVNVQIDVKKAIAFAKNSKTVIDDTNKFVTEIARLSAQEAQKDTKVDFSTLPDLRQSGQFEIEEKILNLNDEKRDRQFNLQVYQPKQSQQEKIPVVIISHGLNSHPESFAEKAKHLASHGFLVVLPQHIGSDLNYGQRFKEGYYSQSSDVNEFINRPLDITYTLDELERLNQTEFDGKLNLENVGMFGHSYGGYTTLAIAGASPSLNFAQLQKDCEIQTESLDTALLLECRALQLNPTDTYDFRDERIKAVIASNPVNASIFGEEGLSKIQIPIMIGAGSYDPATPFIFEQVPSFTWIKAPQRYLYLEEGEAHVDISQLDGGASHLLKMIPRLNLPAPRLLQNYSNAMIVAFYQVHIAQNSNYLPYLSPAYVSYLSENQDFKAFLITEESTNELLKLITQE